MTAPAGGLQEPGTASLNGASPWSVLATPAWVAGSPASLQAVSHKGVWEGRGSHLTPRCWGAAACTLGLLILLPEKRHRMFLGVSLAAHVFITTPVLVVEIVCLVYGAPLFSDSEGQGICVRTVSEMLP